jgi:protocatechuate 3,4-dioxygenase beta subunit
MRREPEHETIGGRRLRRPGEAIFDQGLAFDLETLLDRRHVLKAIGLSGLGLALAACSSGGGSSGSTSATAAASSDGSCATIPEETAGPFPADGSNGPDVLTQSGIVRSDLRASFGDFSGTADGVPLEIRLLLQDASTCSPLPGAAVYAWHCDREAAYSIYGIADQNYLRGVQAADDDGVVTFTSIFPGCYAGRWPHVHFEVYPDLASASDDANAVATSQLAFPAESCEAVYATEGYETSVATLARISLETDTVFGDDGGERQLGTMSGDVTSGFVVALDVPVPAA